MHTNPSRSMPALGQRFWLACPTLDLLPVEEPRSLIERDGLRGAAFVPVAGLYRPDTLAAVRRLADELLSVHEETAGRDGYVSVAVSPHRAYDTPGMIAESHEIMRLLDRPNLMVEVPSTRAGLAALRHLVGEGVTVHASLIFSLSRYVEAVEAYLAGLEKRLSQEKGPARTAAIASFGVRPIDEAVDAVLEALARGEPAQAEEVAGLKGKAAIASAKLAYRTYTGVFTGRRFLELAARGVSPQHLAWVCAGSSGSLLDEERYVDALAGPEAVFLLSREALRRQQEHGRPAVQPYRTVAEALRVLRRLSAAGVNLERVAWQLEARTVQESIQSHDRLVAAATGGRGEA